jgi:Rps23 Pro-64 3,4-dihydroxylase Tpa1-like proline 4-hydroxylase
VWHLTKNWRPRWGGAFYWCPSFAPIEASFNTLVLFNPTAISYHFVTQVSPHARGKRFTVNGWWQAGSAETVIHPRRSECDVATAEVVEITGK